MNPPPEPQCASVVMMVRPAAFGSNPETAPSNRFQAAGDDSPDVVAAARAETEGLAAALERAGVMVHLLDDTPLPRKPDACFPNNWVSFHAGGTVVLYPMLAPSRRLERREDLLAELARRGAFSVRHVIDLTHREAQEQFLEGTGSLVLDRPNRRAWACVSPRTHVDVLGEFGQRLGYDVLAFDAVDPGGTPVYHTNVIMSVGERFAVLASGSIPHPGQRADILESLASTGREIIEIDERQVQAFAGNLLQLATRAGGRVIALSATARDSLDDVQLAALARHGELLAVPVPSIERYGGGSVRCMLAEVF